MSGQVVARQPVRLGWGSAKGSVGGAEEGLAISEGRGEESALLGELGGPYARVRAIELYASSSVRPSAICQHAGRDARRSKVGRDARRLEPHSSRVRCHW